MKQVVLVKGGEAKENYKDFYDYLEKQEFDPYKDTTKRWNRNLQETLGDYYEVLHISMPNRYFADYKAWKIMFEKVFAYLKGEVIFIGHSLGGTFLAKYFEEDLKGYPQGISLQKIILVAPGFKDDQKEILGTFNFKNTEFQNFSKIQDKIVIFGSKDDFIVSFEDIEDYKKYLPKVKYRIFDNYGHFLGEEFPEIIEEIKN